LSKNPIKKISIIEPIGGHGGMDYYDYGLASGLGSNKIKVDFYTCLDTKARKINNVNTVYVFKNIWHKKGLSKLFDFLLGYWKAIRLSAKVNSKIIHLHFFSFTPQNLIILFFAKLRASKIVVTVHDIESFGKNIFQFLERISYPLIDAIIVHNNSSYKELLSKNISLNNIAIIPHGNYLPFIQPNYSVNTNNYNDKIRMLFFGQIKQVKGLEILLEALGKIKYNEINNFELKIAGKVWKDNFEVYQKIIDEYDLGKNIRLNIKFIPDEEVHTYFENCDLVVLPYKKIYQSGVLLKAMSYRRAVLVSNLEAFTDIIKDNVNGFVFESENIDSLTSKLTEIINNPTLIPQIAENGYKYVEKYHDWVDIGKKTLEVYKEVLN